MPKLPSSKSRLLFCLLVITLLTGTFIPGRQVNAQDGGTVREAAIPVLKAPFSVITDSTPTYTWTVVPGAANYQYQVFRSGTLVFTRYPSSSTCGASTCASTPTVSLFRATYKWRVRAKVGGAWQPWSALSEFIITRPPININDGFPGHMMLWERKSGGEWGVTDKAIYSHGLPDKCSALYYVYSRAYANFDYEAKFKIVGEPSGGQFPEAYMALRMGNGVNAADSCWYGGYLFGYSRDGKYSVWKMNKDGTKTAIKGPTYSTAVYKNFWNWIRVVAQGNHFDFYMNDVLLESFT